MGPSLALLLFLVASEIAFSEDQDMSELVRIINSVGTYSYRKAATEGYSNSFISPLNLAIGFGMFYDGIRGKTADERRKVFGYGDVGLTDSGTRVAFRRLREIMIEHSESKEYVMHHITTVLIRKNYPTEQKRNCHLLHNYVATAVDVDFQKGGVKTIQEINNCAKFKTNNLIEKPRVYFDLLPDMVLLNAGCFQGTWKTECDPEDTSIAVFYNRGSYREKTVVEMIHFEGEFLFARLGKGTVLELPFKGDEISLILYLPDDMDGAYEVGPKFQPNVALVALKQGKKSWMSVSFPSFKREYNITWKSFGTPGNTFVSQISHKTFMKIDETGFDGSGIAEVVIGTRMWGGRHTVAHQAPAEANEEGSEPPELTGMQTESRTENKIENMIFNHPFLFALYDTKYSFVYLEGHVYDLSE